MGLRVGGGREGGVSQGCVAMSWGGERRYVCKRTPEDPGGFFVNTESEKKGREEEKKRWRDGWCVESLSFE